MPALTGHPRRRVHAQRRAPLALRPRQRFRRRRQPPRRAIRTGTAVERLLRDGDRVTGVVAGGEPIEAEEMVLATNAYTPLLLPELPAGAIVPARGQILVTQPLPPILPHPFGTNFDKEYGRQTPGGQILCGGYRRLDEDEGLGTTKSASRRPSWPGSPAAWRRSSRAWPGQGRPRLGRDHGLHRRRPAADRPATWAPGLTLAAGFNGGGFSWAASSGW